MLKTGGVRLAIEFATIEDAEEFVRSVFADEDVALYKLDSLDKDKTATMHQFIVKRRGDRPKEFLATKTVAR